jgi:hypothetical protein
LNDTSCPFESVHLIALGQVGGTNALHREITHFPDKTNWRKRSPRISSGDQPSAPLLKCCLYFRKGSVLRRAFHPRSLFGAAAGSTAGIRFAAAGQGDGRSREHH